MTLMRPNVLKVYNNSQLLPANYYSRPAVAPYYRGLNGFGQARGYANQQFEYTMKQMAVSPFSVNSEAYMDRIRDAYGYEDNGSYDTFGTMGGIVGAGVGAMIGAGTVVPQRSLTGLKFWDQGAWQSPFELTGQLNPKRSANKQIFRAGKRYETALEYNKQVELFNTATKELSLSKSAAASRLMDYEKAYDNAYRTWKYKRKADVVGKADALTKLKEAEAARDAALAANTKAIKDAVTKVDEAEKMMNTAFDAVKVVDKGVDSTKLGSKIVTKTSGLMPWLGLGMDTLSLGVSTAGLMQSIEDGDTFNTIFNSIAVAADTASVVGDVLEFTPLAPVGFTLSAIGGIVSIGTSALQGYLVGQTIGRSLSPEGMRAQQMFAENLYSSMVQRPVTSVASLLTMYTLPAVIGSFANNKNVFGKLGNFLTTDALGVQVRAGISMLTLQGVSALTTKVEDKLGLLPENPEDLNFVSAISIYGDVNDNLFGATRNKAILVGLASGDSSAMTQAIARSWGMSDEIYNSVAFDDVRKAAGIDLGNIGNSLISTIGEIIIDPQNVNEVLERYSASQASTAGLKLLSKSLDHEAAKILVTNNVAEDGTLGTLLGEDGLLSVKHMNKETRDLYLKRIFEAYVKDGENGVDDVLAALYIQRTKGDYNVRLAGDQVEIIKDVLNNLFSGDFKHVVGSTSEKEQFRRKLIEYQVIKNKIDNKEKLTEEQQKIRETVEFTFKRLADIYDEDSIPVLIDKVINDFDLKLNEQHPHALYVTYDNVRHHMDLVDSFSGRFTAITNPVPHLIKYIKEGVTVTGKAADKVLASVPGVGKVYEYARNVFTSTDQRARTIVKMKELTDNITKVITTKELDDAIKLEQEQYGYSTKGVMEVIGNYTDSNIHVKEAIAKEVRNDLEKVTEEHAKRKVLIEEVEASIIEMEKNLEDSRKNYIMRPREYSYNKKRGSVFVSEEKLPELEAYITKFETNEATGAPFTPEELKQHIRKTQRTADTLKYQDVKKAVMDYKYQTMYYEQLSGVMKRLRSALKIIDTLTLKLNDDTLALLNSIGLFKVYVNTKLQSVNKNGLTTVTTYFDQDNWSALERALDDPENNPDLEQIDRMLLHHGLIPSVTVKVKNDQGVLEEVVVRGLKAVRVSVNERVPLQFIHIPNLTYSITHTIHKALALTSTESMLQGTVNLPIHFNRKYWKSLENDPETKFKLIIDYINELPLTDKEIARLLDERTLLTIWNNVNKVIYSTPAEDAIQLDDLSEDRLRAIVMSRLFEKKDANTDEKLAINKALQLFRLANKDIQDVYKSMQGEKNLEDIRNVITFQLLQFNINLNNSEAFQFMKSYFRRTSDVAEENLGIFLSDNSRKLLPPYVSKKDIEAIANSPVDYVEKEIIRRYLESPLIQHEIQKRKQEFEYIKDKHNDKAEQTEVEANSEAAQRSKRNRNDNNKRRSSVKSRTYKEAGMRIKHFDDITYNKINNLQVSTDLDTQNIMNLPYVKSMGVPQQIAISKLVSRMLQGQVDDLRIQNILFNLVPSKYAETPDTPVNKLLSYFTIISKHKRSSPGHSKVLLNIAEHIVAIAKDSIDVSKLVQVTKLHPNETDDVTLARRIAETYKQDGQVQIKVAMKDTKKATKLFSKSLYTAALNFMYDNAIALGYKIDDVTEEFSKEDIDHFIARISNEQDTTYNKERGIIFKDATEIFNEALLGGEYSEIQQRLADLTDVLRDYEQKDIRSLSERYFAVSTDVAKKLIFGDARMLALLNDIIKLAQNDPSSVYETGLFDAVAILNEYITEDHANKAQLKRTDVTFITQDPNTQEFLFTVKGVKEPITLFTLIFKYHFNLNMLLNIVEDFTKEEAKRGKPVINNIQFTTNLRTRYYQLLNTYGSILSHNTLDVDKEAFMKQGGSLPEFNVLNDVDSAIIYNNLRFKDVLETDLTEVPEGKKRPLGYKKFKEFFTQEITDIYNKAMDDYSSEDLDKQVLHGINKSNLNVESTILLYIIKSDLPEKIKKNLIKNVFFNQYRVMAGVASKENITKLKQQLETVKTQFKKAKDENKPKLQRKIDGITKRISDYEQRNKNIEYGEFRSTDDETIDGVVVKGIPSSRAFNNFYNHITQNPAKAILFYNNVYSDRQIKNFVHARTVVVDSKGNPVLDVNGDFKLTDKYVLVKHYNDDGTLNVIDKSKGIPSRNEFIGENIIAKHNPETANAYVTKVDKALNDSALKDAGGKLAAASDAGIIITVKDETSVMDIKEFKTNYFKQIGVTNESQIYILTETQYKDISAMQQADDYEIEYDYIVKIQDGVIQGYVPNVINVSANRAKVGAYLADLDLIGSTDVDKIIDNVQKYAEVCNKYTVVNKAYITNTAFNQTETFKKLLSQAHTTRAYLTFMKLLDPNDSGTFHQFNMEKIATLFFKEEFIKVKDGEQPFNVSLLEHKIKAVPHGHTLYQQLKTTLINNQSLYSLVQKALVKMQEEYGKQDISYDLENVLSDDFQTTLRSLTNQVYKVYQDLRKTHKDIYNKILPRLEAKRSRNYITEITPEEISERRKYTKLISRPIRNKNGGYNHAILNPYSDNVKQVGARNTAIDKLKTSLHSKNEYGDSNETVIIKDLEEMRSRHKARVKSINTSRQNKPRTTIRMNALYNILNPLRELWDEMDEYKNDSYNPPKITQLKFSKEKELRNITDDMYDVVNSIKYKIQQVGPDTPEGMALNDSLGDFGATSYMIDSADAFYDYVFQRVITLYTNNLQDSLIPPTYMETINRALAESGFRPELFTVLMDRYWNERQEFRKNRNYAKLDKYRKVVEEQNPIEGVAQPPLEYDIEDYAFDNLFGGYTDPLYKDTVCALFTDILNELEEYLYTNNKPVEPIKLDERVPEYRTIKEYVDSQPEEEREFYKFAVKYFPTPKDFSRLTNEDFARGGYTQYNEEGFLVDKDGNEFYIGDDNFFKTISTLRRKQFEKPYKFKDANHVYRLLHNPLLDKLPAFKDFVKDYFFGKPEEAIAQTKINAYLAHFGITTEQQKNMFFNYSTMEDIINGLRDISVEQMYAFVHVLDMLKEQFLREHYKKVSDDTKDKGIVNKKGETLSEKFSWSRAHHDFVLYPVEQGMYGVNVVEATGTFSRDTAPRHDKHRGNAIDDIYNSTNFIFQTLKFVKDTNIRLGSIIVPVSEKVNEDYDINPIYVGTKESNIFTLTRDVGRKITKVIMKSGNTMSALGEQTYEYNQALGEVVHDFIAERNAKNVDSVGPVKVFNDLRKLYTDLAKMIMDQFKDDQFVRMVDIASALDVMINNPDNIDFYVKELTRYVNLKLDLQADDITVFNTKVSAVVQYFNDKGYLIDGVTSNIVKASLGYIMQNKYKKLFLNTKDYLDSIIQHTNQQVETQHQIKLDRLQSIAYQLTATRDPEELSDIIYGRSLAELTTEESKVFNSVLELQRFIDTGAVLDPRRLYDTYDYVHEGTRDIYHDESSLDIMKQRAEARLKDISQKITNIKTAQTKFKKDNGYTTDAEVKVAYDHIVHLLDESYKLHSNAHSKLSALLKTKDDKKKRMLNEIVVALPELAQEYIETSLKDVATKEATVFAKRNTLKENFNPIVVKEFYDRKEFYKNYKEFFHSIKYTLYKLLKDNNTIDITLLNYADTLKELGITTREEALVWVKDTAKVITEYQTKDAEYKKTMTIKDGDKTLRLEKVFARLKEEDDKIDEIVNDAEKIKAAVSSDVSDFDENVRITIAKDFINSILAKLASTTGGTYENVFKEIINIKTNEQRIRTTVNNVSNKIDALRNEIKDDLLPALKAQGIRPDMNTAVEDINILLSKLDPEDKNVQNTLRMLQVRVRNNLAQREYCQQILDSISNDNVVTVESVLSKVAAELMSDNKIASTHEGIIKVARYLSGDLTEELNQEIKAQKKIVTETLDKYNKAIDEHTKINDFINKLPHELEVLEAQERSLTEQIEGPEGLKERAQKAREVSKSDRAYTNSNIGTYKKLYKLEVDMSDADVLDKVIKDTATSTADGEKVLRNTISHAGEVELHNPIVDGLITRLNYMEQLRLQGKTVPDTFTVLDMETVTDEQGNKVPYQITLIKQINGVVHIVHTYLNNRVFHLEDIQKIKQADGTVKEVVVRLPLLEEFYKQQEMMLRKHNPNITSEEAEAKTKKLVDQIKRQTNHIELITTFVKELNADSDTPIIAHNGSRFDFPNYDVFLSNYARRLLSNLYYQQIKENDPDIIKERLVKSTAGTLSEEGFTEQLIDEYTKVIGKIVQKMYDNKTALAEGRGRVEITRNELRQIHKLNDAIYAIRASNAIDIAEIANNYVADPELKERLLTGEDSEVNQTKQKVYEYITSADNPELRQQIKLDLISYFERGYALLDSIDQHDEITSLVEGLLNTAETQYHELRKGLAEIDYTLLDGYKANRRTIYDMVSEGVIAKTSKPYRPSDLLNSILSTIDQIDDTIKFIQNDDSTVQDTVERIQAQRKSNMQKRTKLQTKYNELKKELETNVKDQEKTMDEIIALAGKINAVTANPVYSANMKVRVFSKNASLDESSLFNNQTNSGLMRLQMDEQVQVMQSTFKELEKIKNYVQALLKDPKNKLTLEEILKSEYIDKDLLDAKTPKDIQRLRTEYEKQRKELIARIETIKDNTMFTSTFTKEIVTLIDSIRKDAKKYIDKLYLQIVELWNKSDTKNILGIDKPFALSAEDRYDYSKYKDFVDLLKEKQEHKDTSHFIELISLLSDRSQLFEALKIYNAEDTQALYNRPGARDLIMNGIKRDITILEGKIEATKKIKLSEDGKDLPMNILSSAMHTFLAEVKSVDSTKNDIERDDLFNLLANSGKRSIDMDEDEQIAAARKSFKDEATLSKVRDERVKRVYDNGLRNDDKIAIIMDKNKVYYTSNILDDGSTIYTISIYDDVNDAVQQFSFSSKNPAAVTFNISYNFTTLGKELIKRPPKKREISNRFEPAKEKKDNLDPYAEYDMGSFGYGEEYTPKYEYLDMNTYLDDVLFNPKHSMNILDGLDENQIHRGANNIDASKESIRRLFAFYSKYQDKFKNFKKSKVSFDDHFAELFKEIKSDQGLEIKNLKAVNMTSRLKEEFMQYLDVIQYAKRGSNYKDIMRVYAGMSSKLLSKFNSLVPGKVLNMIHSDYSTNFILKYDPETLKEFNIDLPNSSEGSAGSSFMTRNMYTVEVPFRHSTNTIRTVLSVPKLYTKFTGIGLINEMYEMEDSNPNKDFMDYLDDATMKPARRKILKDLLVREYNGKRINVFTPNVATQSMYNHYKNDVLHKNGVNVTVAFANDPRAFEDTILADYDDAEALGWINGNKTWLGLYGFKGAIRYVKGLRAMYGATFVANAASVAKRGAYGAALEMAINNIRKYFINSKDPSISSEALAVLNTYESKLRNIFKVTDDGKMIVDPGADYAVILQSISPTLVDDLTVTYAKDVEGVIEYTKASTKEKASVKTDKTIIRGELYVSLDSEHTAEHMFNAGEVTSHSGIHYPISDAKGSIRSGVVISPSVVYTMIAKGGVDWQKAFPADYSKVELYANTMNFGFDYLFKKYGILDTGVSEPYKGIQDLNKLDVVATIKNIESNTKVSKLTKLAGEYLLYNERLSNKNITEHDKDYTEFHLESLQLRVRQQALESLTGLQGAYYKAMFRKHPGIRQQLVANTDLNLGEIKISREGFAELLKMKEGWLQQIDFENTTDPDNPSTRPISKELVDELISLAEDKKVSNKKYAAKMEQYFKEHNLYGNLLAIRSPVQDYNAVPIVKVIGVHDHHAVEANAYMYGMMGGDNDGDTVGLAALDKDQYQALKPLDATKEEYYDTVVDHDKKGRPISYLQNVENDMEYKDAPGLRNIDARYAYVGKRTFAKGTRERFTWDELYLISYGDKVQKYIDGLDISKYLEDATELLGSTKEERLATKRMYMNVLLRKRFGGYDTGRDENGEYNLEDYQNEGKVEKFYNDHKEEILKRILFEKQVENGTFNPALMITVNDVRLHDDMLTTEERDIIIPKEVRKKINKLPYEERKQFLDSYIELFLKQTDEKTQEIKRKIMFNKFYDGILQNTINRIQVSKRGINVFGGNRKKQLVASLLSMFSTINNDKFSTVWKDLDLYVKDKKTGTEYLTVRSVAEGLIADTFVITENMHLNREQFITSAKQNLKQKVDETKFDLDDVLGMVYDNYKKSNQVLTELTSFTNALRSKNPKHLVQHFIDNPTTDPLINSIIEKIKKPGEWINDVDVQWLKTYYFGRFDSDADKLFDNVHSKDKTNAYITGLALQYIDQHIIDRQAFNRLSNKATQIIAVAKHFGIDIDPVEYLARYTREVKEITAQTSVRKIVISDDERVFASSIAMDKNQFKHNEIEIKNEALQKKRKDLIEKYANKKIQLAKEYRTSKRAIIDLNDLIEDNAKIELFGNSIVAGTYKEVRSALLAMFKIFKEEQDIYTSAERMEKELVPGTKITVADTLARYNIASYQVARILINGYTTFKYINNLYNSSNPGKTLSLSDAPYLKDALGFFEVLMHLNIKQERADLEANMDKFPRAASFLLNMNEMDPDLLVIDEYGNTSRVDTNDIEPDTQVVGRLLHQEAIGHLSLNTSTSENIVKMLNELEGATLAELLKKLNLISSKSPKTLADLIAVIRSEFQAAELLHKHFNDDYEKAKYTDTNRAAVETGVANKYGFSYFNIGNYVHSITDSHNKYKQAEKEIIALQKQINELDTEIQSILTVDETLNKQSQFFKGLGTKEENIEDLLKLRKEYVERAEDVQKQMSDFVFNLNFDKLTVLMHTEDGRNIYSLYANANKPKHLTQQNVDLLKASNIVNMQKYQSPFLSVIELYAIKDDDGNTIDYDWHKLYEWYKKNRRFNRLTIVMHAFEDETLIIRLNNIIMKEDAEWDKLSAKEKRKYKNKRAYYKRSKFEKPEDLEKHMDMLAEGEEDTRVTLKGKPYNGMETGLNLRQHITPTLKEIDIRSAKDFKEVFNFIKANETYDDPNNPDKVTSSLMIGFSDLDSVMYAMDQAYRPYRFTGRFADVISYLQQTQKLFMRYSLGFLFRNYIDTWNQLMSELYYERGMNEFVTNMFGKKSIVHYMGMTHRIYQTYQALSEERLLTLTGISLKHVEIDRILEKKQVTTKDFNLLKNHIADIRDHLDAYVKAAELSVSSNDINNRVQARKPRAEYLLGILTHMVEHIETIPADNLDRVNVLRNRKEIKQAVTFLLNMRFAEFYVVHDQLQPHENANSAKIKKYSKYYRDKGPEAYEDFKQVLSEINAFMLTNAQVDQYKSDEYDKLRDMVAKQRQLDDEDSQDLSYEAITERIKEQNAVTVTMLNTLTGRRAYDWMNETIENTGRIAGYLFDRFINGYTFDESVNRSLKRFFNYGQRNSIEMQLIADIPYLSFPIRSIDNWIERLTDPSYLRLMSDILDGMYAQYEDEDGQYDSFTKFQIQNGWLPLFKGVGVRYGNGAFDIQSILSNPASTIKERQSPIIRGVETLARTGNLAEAMKQLATVGVITRAANTLAPREMVQSVAPAIVSSKPRSFANTTTVTYTSFDMKAYEKYTPYKYRYPNNGRYARYENIYRDWFNKYGKMRKPKVDPLSLVKDIQWREYVRWRRSQNIMR